jgi:hypothetical protein
MSRMVRRESRIVIAVSLVAWSCLAVGCSSSETKMSGPVTADMEKAIEAEQKSAEEAEMARHKDGEQ